MLECLSLAQGSCTRMIWTCFSGVGDLDQKERFSNARPTGTQIGPSFLILCSSIILWFFAFDLCFCVSLSVCLSTYLPAQVHTYTHTHIAVVAIRTISFLGSSYKETLVHLRHLGIMATVILDLLILLSCICLFKGKSHFLQKGLQSRMFRAAVLAFAQTLK